MVEGEIKTSKHISSFVFKFVFLRFSEGADYIAEYNFNFEAL